jgi:hypothetical protein
MHDTMCDNVFAFSPLGKIFFAVMNAPGSWHDSTISLPLVAKVLDQIGDYALCVDQGFPRSGNLMDKFVGHYSSKSKKKLAVLQNNCYLRE